MIWVLKAKEKKRIDLVIEPVKSGQWEQVLEWRYYDGFKLKPSSYPELSQIKFDAKVDPNFIRE